MTFIPDEQFSSKSLDFKPSGFVPDQPEQTPQETTQPGIFQGLVQGIAKPFAKTAVTASKAIGGLGGIALGGAGKLFGSRGLQQEGLNLLRQSASTEPTDLGYLGQVKPISSFKEAVGTGADIGLGLATLGGAGTVGKLGAKVAKQAAIGAGFGVAGSMEENQEAKDIIKNALVGASVGGAIPLAGDATSKLKQAITEVLPKGLIKAYLPSNKDLTQHVLENTKLGTTRTMLSDAQKNIKDLSGELSDVLKPIEEKVKTNNIFTSVAKSYGQTGGGGTITGKEVKDIVRKVAPGVKGLLSKDELTYDDLNRIGVEVNRELGDRFFTSKNSAFSKEVAGAFNQFSRDLIKSKAPKSVPIYDELSKNIQVKNALGKAVKRFGKVSMRDLLFTVSGITTGATQGIGGAILGGLSAAAGERILSSPMVGIGAAKGFSKLGKVAIPEAAKRIGRFGAIKATTSE